MAEWLNILIQDFVCLMVHGAALDRFCGMTCRKTEAQAMREAVAWFHASPAVRAAYVRRLPYRRNIATELLRAGRG